jgi:DNA-binding MltR family transcriptional regulator
MAKRPWLDALSLLSRKEMDIKDFAKFGIETKGDSNHRGAAILLVINVELILDGAIRDYLVRSRSSRLFGFESPLGTLNNKIRIAYALDIFGDETFQNLEIMRAVRNAFAHAHIPIDFDTKEIIEAVGKLIPPKLIPPYTIGADKEDISNLVGFQRFKTICEYVGHNLHARRFSRPLKLKTEFIDSRFWEAHPHYEIIGRPAPLP